jgi:soluble lytic murein transglycosylase
LTYDFAIMRPSANYSLRNAFFAVGSFCLLTLGLTSPASSQNRNAETPDRRVQTASLPRFDALIDRAADLPQPLSATDAVLYREIFQLQARGALQAADHQLAQVKNRLLVPHVLADRYLGRHYRASADELAAWLKDNATHPDARAVFNLAVRRAGAKANSLTRPREEASFQEKAAADDLGPSLNRPMPPGNPAGAALRNRLRDQLGDGHFDAVERSLAARETQSVLTAGEIDHLRAMLAAGWFARGDDAKALAFAEPAAKRSGAAVPRAYWIAGLAQFRQENYTRAAGYFEALAKLPQGQPWDLAAGAFWAARTHLRAERPERYNEWMAQAAEFPRTFYGLMAARVLGAEPTANWNPPPLGQGELDQLQRFGGSQRVFGLLQVGEHRRAEAELRRVSAQSGGAANRAILAVSMRANMPGLSMRLAREIADIDGRRFDGAFYPIPHWQPVGGYDVDPALVFAFMRIESAFNPAAVSPAGARGLMQLMPGTAGAMDTRSFKGRADLLLDPEINVTLGQRYIRHLLDEPLIGGELVRLAAAYNGGIGNLTRWKRLQDTRGEKREDALLFIESLPSAETRHFIARLLYSYWMYSERLGQPTQSLDQVAQGEWPFYAAPAALADRAASPFVSLQPPPPPPAQSPRLASEIAAATAANAAAAIVVVPPTPVAAPAVASVARAANVPPPPQPSPRVAALLAPEPPAAPARVSQRR